MNEMVKPLTELEVQVRTLHKEIAELTERVRLDAVARAFVTGNHPVRVGDYFVIDGWPTQLGHITSDGKWGYCDRQSFIEPFRVPPSDDIKRLYTVEEVGEIVAKTLERLAAQARFREPDIKVDSRAWVPLPDGTVTTLSDWISKGGNP